MSTPLLDNFYSYPLPWYTSRDKKYSPFVTAYGVSSVGEVCKLTSILMFPLGGHQTS